MDPSALNLQKINSKTLQNKTELNKLFRKHSSCTSVDKSFNPLHKITKDGKLCMCCLCFTKSSNEFFRSDFSKDVYCLSCVETRMQNELVY